MFLTPTGESKRGRSNSPGTAGASISPSKLDAKPCHIVWCSTCPARVSRGSYFCRCQSSPALSLRHVEMLCALSVSRASSHQGAEVTQHIRVRDGWIAANGALGMRGWEMMWHIQICMESGQSKPFQVDRLICFSAP